MSESKEPKPQILFLQKLQQFNNLHTDKASLTLDILCFSVFLQINVPFILILSGLIVFYFHTFFLYKKPI